MGGRPWYCPPTAPAVPVRAMVAIPCNVILYLGPHTGMPPCLRRDSNEIRRILRRDGVEATTKCCRDAIGRPGRKSESLISVANGPRRWRAAVASARESAQGRRSFRRVGLRERAHFVGTQHDRASGCPVGGAGGGQGEAKGAWFSSPSRNCVDDRQARQSAPLTGQTHEFQMSRVPTRPRTCGVDHRPQAARPRGTGRVAASEVPGCAGTRTPAAATLP